MLIIWNSYDKNNPLGSSKGIIIISSVDHNNVRRRDGFLEAAIRLKTLSRDSLPSSIRRWTWLHISNRHGKNNNPKRSHESRLRPVIYVLSRCCPIRNNQSNRCLINSRILLLFSSFTGASKKLPTAKNWNSFIVIISFVFLLITGTV